LFVETGSEITASFSLTDDVFVTTFCAQTVGAEVVKLRVMTLDAPLASVPMSQESIPPIVGTPTPPAGRASTHVAPETEEYVSSGGKVSDAVTDVTVAGPLLVTVSV
jgi:hypothetical protein